MADGIVVAPRANYWIYDHWAGAVSVPLLLGPNTSHQSVGSLKPCNKGMQLRV